ncbi:DUF559 domain-containing protein [Actinomycetes bacterium KLBMP 9759]
MLNDTGRPFRGSAALAAGTTTRGKLYGPYFTRLYPDVHVAATTPLDPATWSLAAHELVAPHGVLAGYSAAEVLDASCARPGAPAEVLLLGGYRRRPGPMLTVHLDAVEPHELTRVDGLRLTNAVRTAADLARWAPSLTEAVVAVDALARAYRFDPAEILRPGERARRGSARLGEVVRHSDPRSESPMETRIRMAIVLGGLPRPVVQYPVDVGGQGFALDLAYARLRLGIEYNGSHHLTPHRALRDLEREQLLTAAGWRIIRFSAAAALGQPSFIASRVRQELMSRAPA